MTPGRIHDPEGAKTVIISFKIAARAITPIHKQTYKNVCFKDSTRGRLRVDLAATAGGKQDPRKQGLRSILIYKSHIYKEASLDPERCSFKVDQKPRTQWVANQIRQLGRYEDVCSPNIYTQAEYMEENINTGDTGQGDPHAQSTTLPPGGSGVPPTGANAEGTTTATASTHGGTIPTGVNRLRFGTPERPTIPIRNGGGTNTGNNSVEHPNRFAPFRQQGANSGDQGNEALSSGILRGGSKSASSLRGSR
jgi:hypothetical protein